MITSRWKQIFQPLKDFVFITTCFHCEKNLSDNEDRICQECWNSLTKVQDHDRTMAVLRQRLLEFGYIVDCISLFYFEHGNMLQSLAHSLKYQEMTSFGFGAGKKLGKRIKEKNIAVDCIIPVPLNKQKQRERGYNQSNYIAKGTGTILNVPWYDDCIRRARYTTTQTKLSAEQRQRNVHNAFVVTNSSRIQDKTIILVDDVITTGSTIIETARVLMEAGAKKVFAGSIGLAKLDDKYV